MSRRNRNEEGDFRAFMGRTPCAPNEPTRACAECVRHRPALANVPNRAGVVLDATTVTKPGERCPMFFPRSAA